MLIRACHAADCERIQMLSKLCSNAGFLTKLGDHQQGDESEMLVGDQHSGRPVKLQQGIVVAREQGHEEARGDGQQGHELHQTRELLNMLSKECGRLNADGIYLRYKQMLDRTCHFSAQGSCDRKERHIDSHDL